MGDLPLTTVVSNSLPSFHGSGAGSASACAFAVSVRTSVLNLETDRAVYWWLPQWRAARMPGVEYPLMGNLQVTVTFVERHFWR